MLENHMVLGDYYPEDEPIGPDADAECDRLRDLELQYPDQPIGVMKPLNERKKK